MGRPTDESSRPERIRYRETPLQSVLLFAVLSMGMNAVAIGLDGSVPTGESSGVAKVDWWGTWVVALLVMLVIGRYVGVTLTRSTVIVHNVRRRTIPWSNVQAVRVEPYQGTRRVVIYEASGRRTRLRAPVTGFLNWDRGFEEKSHSIGRWWLDHRGPDWVPMPPPWAQSGGPPAPDANSYAPPA